MRKPINRLFVTLCKMHNIGSDGDELTKAKARKIYKQMGGSKTLTPFKFAVLFEDEYGYSGGMCSLVEKWVKEEVK